MRFSAIAALCVAPLALATSLQADLVARGAVSAEANSNAGNTVVVQESGLTSTTEVIIIWVNNGGGAATQTINSAQTTIGSSTISAATHEVTVGGSAGLVYVPDTLEANVGDMVIFTFLSQNHTATQSAFTTPCEKLSGGMDSGFMPNPNGTVNPPPQMAMQVTVTTPLWFYCRQTGHCGKGMTFSINPTANKTQAMFEQMAVMQNGTGSTAVIAGGSASATVASVATVAATTASAAAIQTANSGSMVSGSGTLNSAGACQCSCLCGTAAFPNAAIQGVGAFGGMSGAMPMSALEVSVSTS